jgi:hypothetical protein
MAQRVNVIPLFSASAIPGQVPKRFREIQRTLVPAPKPDPVRAQLERPIHTVPEITRGLGMEATDEQRWNDWIHKEAENAINETGFRRGLMSRLLHEKKVAEVRRLLLSRAITYYRSNVAAATKALILTPDEAADLKKAGAKYYRKVPDSKAKGGFRYIYDQTYSRRGDGDDGADNIKSSIDSMVGEKGCDLKRFKSLVTRYGSRKVAEALKAAGCELKDGQVLRKAPKKDPAAERAKKAKTQKDVAKKAQNDLRFYVFPGLLEKAKRKAPAGQMGFTFTAPKPKPAPKPAPKAGGGVVAIGKRGGRIVGYDAKGNPIYEGSAAARKLEAKVATLKRWTTVQVNGEDWVVSQIHKDGTVTLKRSGQKPRRVQATDLTKPVETLPDKPKAPPKPKPAKKPQRLTKDDPLWTMSPSAYLAIMGVKEPHIMEISPVQLARMSKRARREYDAKRHKEWNASGEAKQKWRQGVIDAYEAGKVSLDDPKLHPEAKSAILGHRVDQKKKSKEELKEAARKANQINGPEDLKVGDRVFTIMGNHYGTVTKVSKKSIRMDIEGFPNSKAFFGALQKLSHRDLEAKVEADWKAQNEKPKPAPKPKEEPKLVLQEPKKPKEPKKKDPDAGVKKLEQTGDHIWGSRKDVRRLAEGSFALEAKDLGNMSFDDAAVIIRKSKIANIPSLDEMRQMGMTPGVANMALALFAAISEKPKDSPMARQQFLDHIRGIEGALKEIKTLDEMRDFIGEMGSKTRRAGRWDQVEDVPKLDDIPANKDVHPADFDTQKKNEKQWIKDRIAELQKDNPGIDYREGWDGRRYRNIIMVKATKPYQALGARFETFVKSRGKLHDEAYKTSLTLDNAWGWSAKEQNLSVDDAWASLAASQEKDKVKKPKQAKPPKDAAGQTKRGFSMVKASRTIVREGAKVTHDSADTERARATFGLREIDYGTEGYMSQADREHHTLNLEHAMHDFVDVLGISPEVLGLNGRVGMALGARGLGGKQAAAAHYEPGRKAINITKWAGGGSVAHEWGHAMDNIISEHFIERSVTQEGSSYLSTHSEHSALPPDLSKAVQGVMKAIKKHPEPEKARAAHKKELAEASQAVESLISQNNRLVREHKDIANKPDPERLERMVARQKERIAEWKSEIEDRKAKIKKKPHRRRSMYSSALDQRELDISHREHWIKQTEEKIAKWQGPDGTKSGADAAKMKEIEDAVEGLRTDINRAKRERKKIQETDPEASDLYRTSMKAGPYYAKTVELFARSFETYVHEKLRGEGRRNTYLVAEGRQAQGVYPQKMERDLVVQAFDELMAVLRKGDHLKKALEALHERFILRKAI